MAIVEIYAYLLLIYVAQFRRQNDFIEWFHPFLLKWDSGYCFLKGEIRIRNVERTISSENTRFVYVFDMSLVFLFF